MEGDNPVVLQALGLLSAAQDAQGQGPRALAAQLQEQLKTGDLRASASVAVALSASGRPLEARVFGLGVLAHLVKSRWKEFSAEDRASLARLALDRLREGAPRCAALRGAQWTCSRLGL
jgi:exportin-5